MIEDKELDNLEKQLREKQQLQSSQQVVETHDFSKKMDEVKQNVLMSASTQDEKFVKTVVENVKEAAVKYTEVEQSKADLEKQKVKYEAEKVGTQRAANANAAAEDKWMNRQKRREYHYNGVAPIMKFVGINEPMNLLFLYVFATVLTIPFFISKIFKGTIGALLCGAEDENRSKAVKGFIWTIIGTIVVLSIASLVYLFLSWRGIDILDKFKS